MDNRMFCPNLQTVHDNKQEGGSVIPQEVASFLLAYRNATTGLTPAQLFMGRRLSSLLDLLSSLDIRRTNGVVPVTYKGRWEPTDIGQRVLARDYRSTTQKWQSGEILLQTRPLLLVWGPTGSGRDRTGLLTSAGDQRVSPQNSKDTVMKLDCATVIVALLFRMSLTLNPQYSATLKETGDPRRGLICS